MKQKNKIIILLLAIACVVGISTIFLGQWPVYLEVGGSLGWNFFGLSCIIFSLLFTLKKASGFMSPVTAKKIPILLATAVFPVLFYYTCLDMFPRLLSTAAIYSVQGINPIPFISNYLIWVTIVNVVPTNLIGFFMYAGFTYAFAWKRLHFKYLAIAFLVSFAANAAVLGFFGDLNVRLFSESNRVVSYYTIYLPSWLLFSFCYAKMWNSRIEWKLFKFWRTNKIPTEEEKLCMGD